MRSSGVVRCLVNGKNCTLSPTSQWFQTDMKGVLNVQLSTADITCHTVTADAYRPATAKEGSADEQSLGTKTLDPSQKLINRLKDIKTTDDLKSVKNSDGKPIISSSVHDDDLKAAVAALTVIRDHRGPASSGGVASGTAPPSVGFDLGDCFNEAWHWVEHKAEEDEEWVVHETGKQSLKSIQSCGCPYLTSRRESSRGCGKSCQGSSERRGANRGGDKASCDQVWAIRHKNR
jgi:hypothetical protein